MKNKTIHVDGGLARYTLFGGVPRGNGYAKLNIDPAKRKTIYLSTLDNTNNEAELFAIIFGITECIALNRNIIYSDSQWCVYAVTGRYKAKEPRLILLVNIIKSLLQYYQIEIKWIRREENLAT